ncbi:MAG: hypothetical protein JNM66_02555 [Bryobacterales bacterium]|nr:hypothetical protein [Bryobacterales bacterium]
MGRENKAHINNHGGHKTNETSATQGNTANSGDLASIINHFVPPHEACLCTEERDDYDAFVAELLAIYKPVNRSGRLAVGDIASASWQIERLKKVITSSWNLTLTACAARPMELPEQLRDIKILVDSTTELLTGNGLLSKVNREIARLQQAVARAERRIKFINKSFPDAPFAVPAPQEPIRTQPVSEPAVANTPLSGDVSETLQNLPQPIYTTECAPNVIKGYQRDFPGRPIVILPAESGENGDDDEFDYRDMPRKVA